jgi:hypothetical protein
MISGTRNMAYFFADLSDFIDVFKELMEVICGVVFMVILRSFELRHPIVLCVICLPLVEAKKI